MPNPNERRFNTGFTNAPAGHQASVMVRRGEAAGAKVAASNATKIAPEVTKVTAESASIQTTSLDSTISEQIANLSNKQKIAAGIAITAVAVTGVLIAFPRVREQVKSAVLSFAGRFRKNPSTATSITTTYVDPLPQDAENETDTVDKDGFVHVSPNQQTETSSQDRILNERAGAANKADNGRNQ